MPTDSSAYALDDSITVLGSNYLQRQGYDFVGWNTAAIPTLSEWRMALMSLILAALGMHHMRRRGMWI